MKKIYIFLFSIFFLQSFSQAPKLINYQGVVRNAAGMPVTSPVKLKFEIFPVSSGGSAAFSEVQSTVTNTLGLFSTQIGKTSPLNINWSTGSWFLELSVDTTNTGSSFTVIGRQQMVSVPFALYAESAGSAPAPAVTFSNNILYVGTNSVSLPPAPVYFAGNGIAINSGTIVNTAPDQTVTISGSGNAAVSGTYPDFTVTAAPQVLAINNNVITLSNGGGNIILPSTSTTPNTSLTSSGIATVTSSGTNTYNIAVSTPTITGTGGTTVGGTYPNFVINSPTIAPAVTPTITGAGIANTSSSGNNYTVSVPGPVLSYGGSVLTVTQGTASSAVTIPAGVTPTLTGTGVANTSSSGNNYTVNVPGPSLSLGGNALTVTQGTTSSTVLLPAPPPTTITGSGVAIVTPTSGNNFNVNVPGPSFTYNNSTGQFILSQGSSNFAGSVSPATSLAGNTLSVGSSTVNLSFWSLQGNTGTNSTNDFIGTTDNVPLNFRVNNQKSGKIDPFSSNTFFGYWSGRDNTIGTQNTAFGINSLLNTTSGAGNTAIGVSALGTNTIGNSNTAIGNSAGFSNNGSNNVFIGYQAGYNATGNSQLYIANSSSGLPLVYGDFSTGRIGLGTTTPGARLEIVNAGAGALRIADGSQAPGKVFTSDGTGLGSWQFLPPTPGNGTANFIPKWNAGGNGLTPTSTLYDNGTFIGVANSAPSARLHLFGVNTSTFMNAFSASPESAIRIHNGDQTNNNFSSLIFSTDASNSASFEAAKIVGVNVNHIAGAIAGDLVFMTRNSSNINEVMRINSAGNIGIGTSSPANRLHVSGGGITITDGSEGAGKVLTSDLSGNGTWKQPTTVTTFGFGNHNLNSVSTSATLLQSSLGSFTKSSSDTRVEVIIQTNILVADLISTTGVVYEIRLNGVAPLANTGRVVYFADNNGTFTSANYLPVNMMAEFPTLAPGNYTIELWVWTVGSGSANTIHADPGNYSTSSVIIKEFR